VNQRPSWNKKRVTSEVVLTSAPVKIGGGRGRAVECVEVGGLSSSEALALTVADLVVGGMLTVLEPNEVTRGGVRG